MDAEAAARRIVDRLIEGAPLRIGQLMRSESTDVLGAARAAAPVRTGAWRDSLRLVQRIQGKSVRVGLSVGDGIEYERYVKFSRKGTIHPGKSAWQELIRKPMRAGAKRIVVSAGPEFLRLARGG